MVEAAEARHITAEQVQNIVLTTFTPDDVSVAVNRLLTEPAWTQQELYKSILNTLGRLETVLSKSARTVDMLASQIAMDPAFAGIERDDILDAAEHMAKASKGMLHVTKPEGVIHVPGRWTNSGGASQGHDRRERDTTAKGNVPRPVGGRRRVRRRG